MSIVKFVDESNHLENDNSPVMTLGYISLNERNWEEYKGIINEIKSKHHLYSEIKWTKVSMSKIDAYKELIDFFFESDMTFRCVLIKYKENLDHDQFNSGSHDNYYYKMVYYLLYNDYIDSSELEYKVYLDYKDTRGREKLRKMKEVFDNKFHQASPFIHFQHIRSDESVFIQLADLFIGAVAYRSKGLDQVKGSSEAKKSLIQYLEDRSGYRLNEGTVPWEEKFNIFDHQPKKG